MMKLSPDEQRGALRALCRQNLGAFTQKSFGLVSPGMPYQHNWHIDAITHHLGEVLAGRIKRLIITLPPRSLKSMCVSVALPAYLLGRNPAARIIAVSYSQDLAEKHARDCKALMENAFYKELFPGSALNPTKSSVSEFTTHKRGFRLATSLGGTLTGRGGDLIILDDPMKPEDALSDVIRTKGLDWFGSTLLSRLDDKENGAIIVVMQRLHEEDLAGHLLAQNNDRSAEEGWHHLNLPAICETDAIIPIGKGKIHARKIGDVLHPDREPLGALISLKANMGAYDFAAQYQQNPAPRGGGLIKLDWFQSFETPFISAACDIIVQSWDTAMSPASGADYSVGTCWTLRKDPKGRWTAWLLDVFREQLAYPQLHKAINRFAQKWSPQHILIEDKGSGMSLLQDLKNSTNLPVKGITPKHDKLTRMQVSTPPLENGRVFLPVKAPWLADYTLELSRFPRAKHDDQVDSTSQFLTWAEINHGPRAQISMGFIT